MHVELTMIMQGALLIGLIALLLWITLLRLSKVHRMSIHETSLTSEELDDYAKRTALMHSISKKKNHLNWPIPRMNDNYEFILSVYKGLNDDIRKKRGLHASAEWLLDNFYIIEGQVKALRSEMTKKNYLRLPSLRSGPLKGYARIFAIAADLVAHTDGQVDEAILADYLKAYQSHSVLFDREIWAIPMVMRLALIESVRSLCETIKSTQLDWHGADELYAEWLKAETHNPEKAAKSLVDRIKAMKDVNPSFIEHLTYQLRRSGRSYVLVLQAMDRALTRMGATLEQITQKEHNAHSVSTVSMGNNITSLRGFGTLDFSDLLESASFVDQILRCDPDGVYSQMNLSTRNYYRSRIEEMASVYGVSEIHIAKEALKLAEAAHSDGAVEGADARRTGHVGYYLVGNGMKILGDGQERAKRPFINRLGLDTLFLKRLYLGSIVLITLVFVALAVGFVVVSRAPHAPLLAALAGVVMLIPASEIAANLVNFIICKALRPAFFPRMELKSGIPVESRTFVVVPTLLPDVGRVQELLKSLEQHYLANREENLYFALIGTCKDADSAVLHDDESIIDAAMRGVEQLNSTYAPPQGEDVFYFCHRDRQYNKKNNKWIGWERKRGALMEFNDLLLSDEDAGFARLSCADISSLGIRYVITLDSDTVLPMGMAKKLIGAMAHPLNRPLIDKKRRVVVDGYGIMQPRVDVDIESSHKSIFSRIFAVQWGIDPYANASSDVYQDLFGEGIFTGKGIYDVAAFQAVLKDAIPEDTILSHDLLEGSYARTALVSDLNLIDSFPSKYNSFSARLHRWVRGDWQLLPLLFPWVFDHSRRKIKNPLSVLSKWKMFDNLRRSLAPPALMALALMSFCVLPGNAGVWLGLFLIAAELPLVTAAIRLVFSPWFQNGRMRRHAPQLAAFKTALIQGVLTLAFLPHQAALMLGAICVTLVRILFTKRDLLQWVTSADVEKTQQNSIGSYLSKMSACFVAAAAVVVLAIAFKPEATLASVALAALWASAPFIAFFISKDRRTAVPEVSAEERARLGAIARKTWRYFEEFVNAKGNHLAPDNYQEDPPRGLAHRTSPTNIGLGLLAALSARDLGYIGTAELVELIDKTISTMEGLPKWNGHLYNWYDTRSLRILRPGYVSTVDSGNLVGYLITLEQGLKGYLHSPLIDARFLSGIQDTLACAGQTGSADHAKIIAIRAIHEKKPMDTMLWNQILNTFLGNGMFGSIKIAAWKAKIDHMVSRAKKELADFMPHIALLDGIPEGLYAGNISAGQSADFAELLSLLGKNTAVIDMPDAYEDAARRVRHMIAGMRLSGTAEGDAYLCSLERALAGATDATRRFVDGFSALIARVHALSAAMAFAPLYVEKNQLFSIGYNVEENELTNSYYDLLASEARQTSYIAIARGEIPAAHWFRMGRTLTAMDGYKGLISWTGTMFEYLMPLLIMKNYKDTLLDETYSFVIRSQMKYGRQRDMPWGASESGFNSLDSHLDYQYKAIGVPWLGLKRGLIQDAVASPYSTFLALHVDPKAAIQNIARLEADGIEGSYGFYEAADYTPERLVFELEGVIIKSYMAHHQGMSLVAMNNFLNGDIMQQRFHSNPEMHMARLLLLERIPSNLLFTKENREKVAPLRQEPMGDQIPMRVFRQIDPALPKAHILTNGNYAIMITDRGTGLSKSRMVSVSRWREDSTLDPHGMFFYLRNVDTDAVWSAAYAPLNVVPDQYEVVFTADKATFKRVDGQIETKTEVTIASGDNTEFRRITMKNLGSRPCTMEVTSYFEVVLAPQAADVAHPAFSNLFIETKYLPDKRCIIANRRPRSDSEKGLWMGNAVVLNGDTIGAVQYETDRMAFLGRGNTPKSPAMMQRGRPLSNTVGSVLDPVMSLRVSVRVDPGKTVSVSYVTTIGNTNEALSLLLDKYASPDAVERAFQLALARGQVETRYSGLNATEIECYQDMLSHIIFSASAGRASRSAVPKPYGGQALLWRHGISGDIPIVAVNLNKTDHLKILFEALRAHEYWWLLGLKVDLVIMSDEDFGYENPMSALIADIVSLRQTRFAPNEPGSVFVLSKRDLQTEDIHALFSAARLVLSGDAGNMEAQMAALVGEQPPPLPHRAIFGKPTACDPPVAEWIELQYFNGLGGFGADGREYVIRLERDQNTPAPWVNVIANPRFGFIASDAGSGYTWHENSHETKLTPWSNDAVSDAQGEAFYISDKDSGECFTATALPIRDDAPYTIRHGFGYTSYAHTSHGIEQRLTQHVPVDDSVKLSTLRLKNTCGKKRNLIVTYYMRPVLGASDQATAMHIRTSVAPTGTLLIENPYHSVGAGTFCFIDVSIKERCVTGDRKEFFGTGDMSAPECLLREGLSGATGTGYDPCGAMQVCVRLNPNESREITFLLGMAQGAQAACDLARRYRKAGAAKESLIRVQRFWEDKLGAIQVSTPTDSMNLMLNGWLEYQVVSCRLWARSGFYQSGGAFGFRDQLQDCLSVAHLWPELARAQILLHARHQFPEGDVQHWWHEPDGNGVRTRFTDDRLWLAYAASEYIRITGDDAILAEQLPFLMDAPLSELEDERYSRPGVTDLQTSLYDHCVRAVEVSLRFGSHGLPLMGGGDWNDGMNTVGNKGTGESVWLGWFLATVLEMMAPICAKAGDRERADGFLEARQTLLAAIERSAWDGNWYRRAYFDDGTPLGSVQNDECKIDSIAQSWAVISGGADPQRAKLAMDSLMAYLVQWEAGLIQLFTPPFDAGDAEPGYIKGYVPGVRENGGQYTHAAVWAIIAFAKMGDGDRAWELFRLINPIKHASNYREYSRYKLEPYVMSADVYAADAHVGRGGWSWYTGSAGWMNRAGLEHILGFQKNGDVVVMDPCIPRKWQEYSIRYKYMDTTYDIRVENPHARNKGVHSISLDGVTTAGNQIQLENDGKHHEALVMMH